MLRLMLVLMLQLIVIDYATASESAYVPTRRFMPLPPPKPSLAQRQETTKTTKFFPLTQTRYPTPARLQKNSIASGIVKSAGKNITPENNIGELSDNYVNNAGSGKKVNMSEDDAQQIISIFTATK